MTIGTTTVTILTVVAMHIDLQIVHRDRQVQHAQEIFVMLDPHHLPEEVVHHLLMKQNIREEEEKMHAAVHLDVNPKALQE
jgi:hypothetical protein